MILKNWKDVSAASSRLKGCVKWALMVALVLGTGLLAQSPTWAQGDTQEGRIVRIAPERDRTQAPDLSGTEQTPRVIQPGFPEAAPQQSQYWIGIVGGPLTPELRAHVDVPQGEGLLINQVMPGSPAAEGGLRTFDILLHANNTPLTDMRQLAEMVTTEGERQSQITLDILRGGQRQTVWVTPADRPADARPQGLMGGGQFPGQMALPQGEVEDLMRQLEGMFGRPGQGFSFRNFGPGVVLGQQSSQLPNGVSMSIEKQNDQPPRITVQRDGETWEVVGGDPESLDQLPDDLRPYVEQMLRQNTGPFSLNLGGEGLGRMMPQLGRGNPDLQQRLEQLDDQLEELRERFGGQEQPAQPEAR